MKYLAYISAALLVLNVFGIIDVSAFWIILPIILPVSLALAGLLASILATTIIAYKLTKK